jgi:hypothetical protein
LLLFLASVGALQPEELEPVAQIHGRADLEGVRYIRAPQVSVEIKVATLAYTNTPLQIITQACLNRSSKCEIMQALTTLKLADAKFNMIIISDI